jgi:hypothetical protein
VLWLVVVVEAVAKAEVEAVVKAVAKAVVKAVVKAVAKAEVKAVAKAEVKANKCNNKVATMVMHLLLLMPWVKALMVKELPITMLLDLLVSKKRLVWLVEKDAEEGTDR